MIAEEKGLAAKINVSLALESIFLMVFKIFYVHL